MHVICNDQKRLVRLEKPKAGLLSSVLERWFIESLVFVRCSGGKAPAALEAGEEEDTMV